MGKDILVYLVTIILVILLLVTILLSILILRKKALKTIRSKTLGLVSMYDDVLDERSKLLNSCNTNVENNEIVKDNNYFNRESELSKTIIDTAERNNVDYRNNNTASVYQLIRSNFNFDSNKIYQDLKLSKVKSETAKKALELLSFESVYNLSTLTKDDQEKIIKELKVKEIDEELTKYKQVKDEFDIISFYEFIKDDAFYELSHIDLRVPTHFRGTYSKDCNLIFDEKICEGFQIETGTTLYDYSIQKRDVN